MRLIIDPLSQFLTLRFSPANQPIGFISGEIWIELSESRNNQTTVSALNVTRLEDLKHIPNTLTSLMSMGFDCRKVSTADWVLIRNYCRDVAAFDPAWPAG